MTWNYRVVHRVINAKDIYAVHEVYYDEDGLPEMVTEEPVNAQGETYEELVHDVVHYIAALAYPILEYDEIGEGR
jgi:hypothetical protein